MKKVIIFAIFNFMMLNVFSQLNSEIKKHSRNNQSGSNQSGNNGSSSNSESSSSSSSDDDIGTEIAGACIETCVSACASGFFDIFIDVLGNIGESNGEYVDDKKDDVPYISHFDMAFQLGVLPNQYLVYLPRIRGQYGVFGTDFRVYHNQEYRLKETDPYTTYDWQILVLNLVSVEQVNWRIASGIMVESFDGDNFTFNEHTMAFSIFPSQKITLNVEGRLTPDYETGIMARQEVNANVLYQLNKSENIKVNLMLGFLSARYYQAVNVWTTSLGVSLTFQ